MDKLKKLFNQKSDILNIYLTAGYPEIDDTLDICLALANAGVDIIEIGIPYSDPLADGPVIQASGTKALQNGITTRIILRQIAQIRKKTNIPIVLMGYYNPILQYGAKDFFEDAKNAGVDGMIIPDLPVADYLKNYENLFSKIEMAMTFLVTPQTSNERVKMLAKISTGFLYMVSSFGLTGGNAEIDEKLKAYYKRIGHLAPTTPKLIGFGIRDHASYKKACDYANGAIIGSAFIKALSQGGAIEKQVHTFVAKIRKG